MQKNCPKCGAENKFDAKFCRKCGYKFKNSEVKNPAVSNNDITKMRENIRKADNNSRSKWLIIIIVLLLIVIVFLLLRNSNSNNQKGGSSQSETTSAQTSGEKTSSSAKKSPSHSYELTTGSSPKLDAAELIYYVAKNNISDSSIDSNGYIVRIPSDSSLLDSLSKKGQNQVYEVYREENRNDGGPVFIYTIDSDDTINIYKESENEGFDPDRTYDPVKSITKAKIVSYLNNYNMGSGVKELSNQIEIQQTDRD